MKEIKRELVVIQEKKQSLLKVDNLLYLLVPQSKAVVEKVFSCLRLIMTDKRTNKHSKN